MVFNGLGTPALPSFPPAIVFLGLPWQLGDAGKSSMMLTIDAHVEAKLLVVPRCLGFSSLFRHLVYPLHLTVLRACQILGKYADPPHEIFTHAPSSHCPTPTVPHRPMGPGAPGT
jgi:hypothetical protein